MPENTDIGIFLTDYAKNQSRFEFIALDAKTTLMSGYTPSDTLMVNYCVMQGGNINAAITTDLGTEVLKAFDEAALAKYQGMSFEQRKATYFKDGFDLKFTDSYGATFRGNNYKGKSAFNTTYECKVPNSGTIFTAKPYHGVENIDHWIVTHKEEPMVEYMATPIGELLASDKANISTDIKQKMLKKFPSYEAYFDDWNSGFLNKKNKQKLGTNYRMRNTFEFDKKFWNQKSMERLFDVNYFCEANGGQFTKEGKPFRTFLKDFYTSGANPINYNEYGSVTSPFVGNYACTNVQEPFTMELGEIKANALNFKLDYALIQKGSPSMNQPESKPLTKNEPASFFQEPTRQQQVQQPVVVPQQQPSQNNPMGALMQQYMGMFGGMMPQRGMGSQMAAQSMGVDPTEASLVMNAIATKGPYGSQQGANVSTALYNGKDAQGCDLVALEKSVANMPNSKRVHNFKMCNGQLMTLGETGLNGLPKKGEIDPIITQVKNQCKAYGAFGSQYQDLSISCRALDINRCNLETTVMQNGQMIEKKVENSCQ